MNPLPMVQGPRAGFFTPAVWQAKKSTGEGRLPECGKCGLYKKCESPKMKPSGEGERRVLFVGEAPGETEDEKGVQLIGKAGQRLRDTLRELRFDLDEGWKTNAIICRPPKNKIEPLHIECCRPNLLKTVRDLEPRVIVLMGGSAVRGLLPAEREADVGSISRWVGWTIPSREFGAWICPTYHPSYLLRMNDKVLDLLFREHLEKAISLEKIKPRGEDLDKLKEKVEKITDQRQAVLRLKDLAKKKGWLAFDYEANRLKPDHPGAKIVACSFSLDGEDTFSIHTTSPEVLEGISRVLRNPRLKKIASNLKNEERWTRRILGHPVASWGWDTMLAAHVHDNRQGVTSLKFQVFVYFGISDYDRTVDLYFSQTDKDGFNRIEDCPLDELLTYNGLDSLLEWMLMIEQKKRMSIS